MGVEDFRRWHWATIGVLTGLAFGGVRAFYGPDLDTGFVRRLNAQAEFEQGLTRSPDTRGKVNNVTIHPEMDGRIWLTFTQIRQTGERMDPKDPSSPMKGIADPVRFDVSEPYKPASVVPTTPKPDLTVREYLADVQKHHPNAELKFRYAWWEVPRNTLAIYALGGLVLIGGIWPSVVGLITGAGIWGPRPNKDKDGYDLSRFAGGADATKAGAAVVSDDEKAKLAELEEAMLAKLDGFGAPNRDQGSIDEDAPVVQPLAGGPSDHDVAAAVRAEQDAKEYKGDFYPVARPGGKKDE